MMVPSHAVVGVALTAPLLVVAPELAPVAALAGFLGGVFPDLDLLVGTHRKTLHFPLVGWLVALPALVAAALVQTPATVVVAAFTVAAAVHAGMDALGAGEELRPWERTNPYAVYLHPRGRWLRARYWVPYDGSPHDLAVTLARLSLWLHTFVPGLPLTAFEHTVRTGDSLAGVGRLDELAGTLESGATGMDEDSLSGIHEEIGELGAFVDTAAASSRPAPK